MEKELSRVAERNRGRFISPRRPCHETIFVAKVSLLLSFSQMDKVVTEVGAYGYIAVQVWGTSFPPVL